MRAIKLLICWIAILFTLWKVFDWWVWNVYVPEPITDWQVRGSVIRSPSAPDVVLTIIGPWEIKGRVLFRKRIIDPILPTLGKFPENFISPVDVFIAREEWAKPLQFRTIKASHEFRTAWFETPSGSFKPEYVAHEHTIPANWLILQSLLDLKKGQYIRLSGYIVDIRVDDVPEPRKYFTSDSLYDTGMKGSRPGSGACEILFVTQVEILEEPEWVGRL